MKIIYELDNGESFSNNTAELRVAEALFKSLETERLSRVVDYLRLMIKHKTCKRLIDEFDVETILKE